jgi:two-component system response regulator DevR
MSRITVFLVDDHELVRRGVAEILGREPDIEVVGEAGTAADAISGIEAIRPDVVVLDVQLPDGNGIDVCRFVSRAVPGTRCLILTSHDEAAALYGAVLAGAAGYVIKNIYGSQLVESVRAVGYGRSLIDATVKRQAQAELRSQVVGDPRLRGLTPRQREVLALISEGLTNRQIGQRMGLAEKTIKNYVSGILSELGLERRAQAVVAGLDRQRAER